MTHNHEELIALLKSPGGLQPLKKISDTELESTDGQRFPIIDGIVCLLTAEERGTDLGDKKFYEENPFGLRDWSDPAEVEAAAEDDMKEILKDMPKDAKIADIGAGTGRVSNYLSMKGFANVVSVDYSLISLKMIQKNSDCFCIWGNNLHLPLASNSFDFVISTGVIHHTPDPKTAFHECARIVKPSGLLYFRTRNIHSLYGYLFHTYGAVLRFFESKKSLRFLSNLLGFQVYKLTRRVFYSHLPKKEDKVLRGKYENLFIKEMITFFNTRQVEKMLKNNNLEILSGRKTSFTHRQHFYVAKKNKI
jgi:ubiquinone/menaquinone biosynthesis C-methylase UbiE